MSKEAPHPNNYVNQDRIEQSTAGELTKEIRQIAKVNFESHNYGEKIIAHIDRNIVFEACDRLDTSEATIKELLEVCEELVSIFDKEFFMSGVVNLPKIHKAKKRAVAAISKEKTGGINRNWIIGEREAKNEKERKNRNLWRAKMSQG